MRCVPVTVLAVLALVVLPAARADDESDKSATPRQRYQALFQEYRRAMEAFSEAYQKAKTNEERQKLFDEKYPKPQSYTGRFLEIVDAAPNDPAAVDALVWVVENGGSGPDVNRAVKTLADKHPAHRRMGEVAPRLSRSYSPAAQALLEAILEKNPEREVKGQASLALGQFLKQRADLVRSVREGPERAKQIESFLRGQGSSKDDVARLLEQDPDALLAKAEAAFERTERDFGDLGAGRSTLGKTAKAELYEIRNLAVGKPAPDITGKDLEDQPLKLSDYKGKVVVLDFWGDW
jgi:hypothetical protein